MQVYRSYLQAKSYREIGETSTQLGKKYPLRSRLVSSIINENVGLCKLTRLPLGWKMSYITELHSITLIGRIIRLEPLSESHVPNLIFSGRDESIWQYMVVGRIQTEEQMRTWVLELISRQGEGYDLPFAVIYLETGRAIGMTRYLDIDPHHRSLEIGGTWYAPRYQRTRVNTEAKYLLLKHAFEVLGCVRVQLKTDARNELSQRAIERIGGVREGLLRNHMILPDGYVRDSLVYSIIDREWLEVKSKLEKMLIDCTYPGLVS